MPNRYGSFDMQALEYEQKENLSIYRIKVPLHKSGMLDQILTFRSYYFNVKKLTLRKKYDLVFVSSSRLFTAYLGYQIAKRQRIPLYLDIRDIFVDTIEDVIKSKIKRMVLMPILNKIERNVFNYASHINLISEGFTPYFSRYKKSNLSFYSNGIDKLFLGQNVDENDDILPKSNLDSYVITYAGNIGEGQGLEKIIPESARLLGDKFQFLVIGDGGAREKLIAEIERLDLKNIVVKPPTNRINLIRTYKESHFLFLHLNDYKAFKKVLPSKVFELGAFDKPIIAGVSGFAYEFIKRNLSNVILFAPGDVNNMVSQLLNFSYKTQSRQEFIKRFRRENINRELAKSIISYI